MSKCVDVGGQAVIEGVMMKTRDRIATVVRREDGSLVKKVDSFSSFTKKSVLFRFPFVRGIFSLFELMFVGMKALTWSANQQTDVEEEQLKGWHITLTVLISLLFGVGLFVLLPYGLSYAITSSQGLFFNLVDGAFRLLIFVIYLAGIGLMSDITRVFQYHGAEHKSVHCYEHGDPLTPENVLKHSRIHPRCGTSLLVFVLGLSILLFSLLKSHFWYVNLSLRILLIPVIAGISYEVIKFSARHPRNFFFRIIIAPGLWTQQLTTREPDAKQCEVAIKALKEALP